MGTLLAFHLAMLKNFQAFHLAKEHYQLCKQLKLPMFLKDQLLRASSSVALNLAEASGKRTPKDQIRFYSIALGSLRECEAIFEIESIRDEKVRKLCDRLGAIIFKLCRINQTSNGTSDLKR
ncbi:MAG: four helix bundle protein [Bdellovibrionales bacterium]